MWLSPKSTDNGRRSGFCNTSIVSAILTQSCLTYKWGVLTRNQVCISDLRPWFQSGQTAILKSNVFVHLRYSLIHLMRYTFQIDLQSLFFETSRFHFCGDWSDFHCFPFLSQWLTVCYISPVLIICLHGLTFFSYITPNIPPPLRHIRASFHSVIFYRQRSFFYPYI